MIALQKNYRFVEWEVIWQASDSSLSKELQDYTMKFILRLVPAFMDPKRVLIRNFLHAWTGHDVVKIERVLIHQKWKK